MNYKHQTGGGICIYNAVGYEVAQINDASAALKVSLMVDTLLRQPCGGRIRAADFLSGVVEGLLAAKVPVKPLGSAL